MERRKGGESREKEEHRMEKIGKDGEAYAGVRDRRWERKKDTEEGRERKESYGARWDGEVWGGRWGGEAGGMELQQNRLGENKGEKRC